MNGHFARVALSRALVSAAPPLLVVLAFLAYALTSPGLTRGHAAGIYATAATLVERGHPAIDGAIVAVAPAPTGADAAPAAYGPLAYAAGHYYHSAPPGPALLAAPAYALGLALAPWLGPDAPAGLVVLLGPLLGALAVAALWRLARGLRDRDRLVLTAAGALLLWPFAGAPTAPLVAATLLAWLLPTLRALWALGEERGAPPQPPNPGGSEAGGAQRPMGDLIAIRGTVPHPGIGGGISRAFLAGAGLASLLLVDYVAGALACLALLTLLVRLRRRPRLALALIAGAALPALALAAWHTVTFGQPWRPGFRFAVDPAARSLRSPVLGAWRALMVMAIPLCTLLVARGLAIATTTASRARAARLLLAAGIAIGLTAPLLVLAARRDETILPLDWRTPAGFVPLLVGSALLLTALGLTGRGRVALRRGTAVPASALLLIALVALSAACGPAMTGRVDGGATGENYLAPFTLAPTTAQPPLPSPWELDDVSRVEGLPRPQLHIGVGGKAISPWIDVTPGTAYLFAADVTGHGAGDLRVVFSWEDAARRPLLEQAQASDDPSPRGRASHRARFAAPVGAAGLRLRLEAGSGEVIVEDARLTLAAGARVEPFPDYARAALAFSFDWESAMGGLIHSRSASGEGEGHAVSLTAEGAPSVAEAEQRGLLMREGAHFLADTFARHGVRATFYATGYNLLDGNPTCQKFLGDPVYRNVNRANGWGSDYWRTHHWYEHDPCSTEEQAPAWYFASLTRELAAAGHEIASHTFGHLYVRGVSPEQLEADLNQWLESARDLGVPVAPSFAFPWTSSNSLTPDFFAVFERLGLTVLTRLYPPLRHPFELDRVPTNPSLTVFPDQYLPSTPEAERAAVAAIDEALARRGYLSLWAHPDEVMLQDGPVIWTRVVAHAAAQRERGLWVAPVAETAQYSLATREVAVTALPVAGGWRLIVENRSSRALDGLTLTLPADALHVTVDGRPSNDTRAGQLRLATLAPGARVTILAQR